MCIRLSSTNLRVRECDEDWVEGERDNDNNPQQEERKKGAMNNQISIISKENNCFFNIVFHSSFT